MTDWTQYAQDVKLSVWGPPEPVDHSPLWTAKFCGRIEHPPVYEGGVKVSQAWTEYLIDPNFTTEGFIKQRAAELRATSTRNAHTVLSP